MKLTELFNESRKLFPKKKVDSEGFEKGRELGKIAYSKEIKVPAHDKDLFEVIKLQKYDTISLLDGWARGWAEAHNGATPFDFS